MMAEIDRLAAEPQPGHGHNYSGLFISGLLFHRTPTTAAVVADNDTLTAGPQSGREQPEDFVAPAPTKPSLLAYVRSIFLCPTVQSHHSPHVSLE